MTDERLYRPATQRNRAPILEVLRGVLPASGLVLEVASGSGEHAVYFARHFPALEWQPSDPSPQARRSIAAWIAAEQVANVRAPLDLDVTAQCWPVAGADAIVCINMIHISPWEATAGLMRGAGQLLACGAPLFLYGPFKRGKRPLEPGNVAFDERLRSEDPRWGLRELGDV
ncbi:MAG: class I SAM-dependent methyltransferase, partial [Novosphingobium sp.]|nr:class I SAM-dependent methyltransferase [Novosphingobium sp.]